MREFKKRILSILLYNRLVKEIANVVIGSSFLRKNPIYAAVLNKQINRVVQRHKKRPFSLRIENTNICNARCFMCPHSTMKRKQGIMSRALYRKIIDEAVKMGIDFVNLHNFGEPLLDKDFIWRVIYAKKRGIFRISTNTNAQVLNRNLAKALVESGLDEVFISLDAFSKETYQKIRIGLNYDTVMNNVFRLAEVRKKMGKNQPEIIVDFLESNLNRKETRSFIKRWRGIVDHICVSKIHDWSAKKKEFANSCYQNYVSHSRTPCRLPFTELLVNWDGTSSLCCQDIEGEVIIGDVNKQTLAEIWNGEKIKAIRKKHREIDTDRLTLCKDCKLRTFWWAF